MHKKGACCPACEAEMIAEKIRRKQSNFKRKKA